jgi:hypothetical protein
MNLARYTFFFFIFLHLNSPMNAQSSGYWQQQVEYDIRVSLNDSVNFLTGNISMIYRNHSPDTLRYIWFHLWPNAYKNTETAFAKQQLENGNTKFYYADEKDRGYISGLDFTVNGHPAVLQYDSVNIDIAKLILPGPLSPGSEIIVATPFTVKIPYTFSRMGHVGQSYQVTQWYPKPAVYDRFGWHPMPYLDQGEFYSEFGSFDVSITLPKNYVVGATGELQTKDEQIWLDSLAIAGEKKFASTTPASPSVASRGRKVDNTSFPPSSLQLKTLQYHADSVHDFAWFADKRYNVEKGAVSLPGSGKTITTWTLFTDKYAALWKNAIHYVDSSVYYYSKWVGDYPYPQATAVEGALEAGDGMEYPMITVISGGFSGVKSLETVIAHEVGHNWFYGVLGFNEREHPWMDEGINSYYENRYVEKRYPYEGLVPGNRGLAKIFGLDKYPRGYQNYLLYIFQAGRRLDQPMDINAADFTSLNYAGIVYSKTAIVWKYLEADLGTPAYDELMQEFFRQWSFKHPDPSDLKKFAEEKTHKEFDWLFNQTIQIKEYLDYKLVHAKDTAVVGNTAYQVLTIANKKDIKGAYSIDAITDGKVVNELWYGGFNGRMNVLFPAGSYDAFRIDAHMEMPELNRQNNMVKTSGLFRQMEKLRLQWLGSVDDPQRTQLFFTPAFGVNNYDKFWLSLALYNSPLQNKPFSFVFMPAYGFGSNKIIGLGQVSLQLFPKKGFIRRVDITSSYKTFDYANSSYFGAEGDEVFRFMKFTQQVTLDLRKRNMRSSISQQLIYRNIFLQEELPPNAPPHLFSKRQMINQATYNFQDKRIINPFGFSFTAEGGSQLQSDFYLKTFLTGNYKINYPRKKYGLDVRVFAGVMLVDDNDNDYAMLHLGPTTGRTDYRFDQAYLGRTETTGFLSQQIAVADDGGFKMRTEGVTPTLGSSDSYVVSLNVKAPLPFVANIFVFADAGIAPGTSYSYFQYDGGIGIKLIPNVVEVYLPFVFSPDMKQNLNTTDFYDTWYKRISFTFNISALNPFEFIRNFQGF